MLLLLQRVLKKLQTAVTPVETEVGVQVLRHRGVIPDLLFEAGLQLQPHERLHACRLQVPSDFFVGHVLVLVVVPQRLLRGLARGHYFVEDGGLALDVQLAVGDPLVETPIQLPIRYEVVEVAVFRVRLEDFGGFALVQQCFGAGVGALSFCLLGARGQRRRFNRDDVRVGLLENLAK